MTRAVQRRRGTTAQHTTFIGLQAELTVDIDQNKLILHDGVTPGGIPLASEEFVLSNASAGADGKSAYQIAIDNGFVGTQAEWLSSLEGTSGIDGLDGKSAYQIALDAGFVGTESQWLGSLHGTNGIDGTNGQDGIDGSNGVDGTNGQDGKSAYQIAVDAGFAGTEAQWLLSLKGVDGINGTNGVDGQDASTGDISITQATITTALPDQSIIIAPNGTGELHVSANIGVENTNPGYSIHVGNVSEAASSGDIGFSFFDGIDYSNTASIGWSWFNGVDMGNNQTPPKHAIFGLFKNGSPNSPWISFDENTPANVIVFAPTTGDAIFTGKVVATAGVKFGDGTEQTTNRIVTVPSTAIGATGDTAGQIAVDSTYLYVCTANYDGTSNIWTRTPLGTTW